MARTTISLDDQLYALSLEVGRLERRDFSNLCAVALDELLKSRGHQPSSSKKAELLAAVAEIGEDRALEILTRAARRKAKGERAAA